MNRRQKAIVIEVAAVVTVTVIAVVGMINLKDWINRSEAIRAMEQLGRRVRDYRMAHGTVPTQSYVDRVREDLEGHVRLGDLNYRGLWIDLESGPDEILAYTQKNYRSSFLGRGYVVLRLSGQVQWLGRQEFETLLPLQQDPAEVHMLEH